MAETENRHDLDHILLRVREKNQSYNQYNFSQVQNNLLKSFFDLAQEFDSLHDLYRICVAAPHEIMGLECSLYLLDRELAHLELVCTSSDGVVVQENRPVPTGIYPSTESYCTGNTYVVPIYRKPLSVLINDEAAADDDSGLTPASLLMGLFVISPVDNLTEENRFFFTKYANRIGYRLHNRLIAQQNIQHLRFINSLVMDIEHNVIIPNMYFRYLFNQLKKKIFEIENLEKMMIKVKDSSSVSPEQCHSIISAMSTLREELSGYHQEIQKHHANVSLFLESLFRREHFQKGHLVLQPKRCLVENDIIKPQLEQYRKRLEAEGITIYEPGDMAREEFPIMVDIGLLSQVYANFFSNAVKYTREIRDRQGVPRKVLAYGREILYDFFGPGQNAIKFNVFTTGYHLGPEDAALLFTEGGRCSNSSGRSGSGHGLAFIKHVIEMHGGTVGYEKTEQGNNFYIILPLPITKSFSLLPNPARK